MALFDKILIANRGEIACRIIRTARRLNIKTVAVFSEADANALHVKLADEAYLLGPAISKESYLNIKKIIQIAKLAKVTAIHPGYGFLSENAEFAHACEVANITFIGPSASVIALMANKNVAKDIMQKNTVPVLPGYYDEQQSLSELITAAKQIGYPLVLKAVAGGGGKGLRLVQNESEFSHAYEAVRREAKAFFNDDKIIVEKYLLNARHIEVQILADHFGMIQPLYTRDCSIQRRHQKIVEEAPAPNLSEELNEKLIAAAMQAGKAIQYTNAGTIEFLVADQALYFMEMNTRLQVEHPVTEMITGLDIVEWQFRIAAGEKLFNKVAPIKGHAVEVRLNAEDPEQDFLPSAGQLNYFHFPNPNLHVRIDTGYMQGDKVDIYYDSLLAKLIVWDENRSLAIQRLQRLCQETTLFGIRTNLSLLKQIIEDKDFLQSNITTHFLQQHTFSVKKELNDKVVSISALFLLLLNKMRTTPHHQGDIFSPWQHHDGWQLYFEPGIKLQLGHGSNAVNIKISFNNVRYLVEFNENKHEITLSDLTALDNNLFQIAAIMHQEYIEAKIFNSPNKLELLLENQHYFIDIPQSNGHVFHHEQEEHLLAPMPGTIVALHVNSGQKVIKGDKLLVIEAMKMEHTLYAPRDGVIKQCHYQIGDLIKEGSELIEFE